jgi:hypothetical protein
MAPTSTESTRWHEADAMNPRPRFRELTADSIKYWEPRRILYNAVLAIIVLGYFAAAWPASKAIISLNSILILFLLTVLANICYCAVYVIDVFVQLSGLRDLWLRRRWLLLLVGTAFAAILTRFIAMAAFS